MFFFFLIYIDIYLDLIKIHDITVIFLHQTLAFRKLCPRSKTKYGWPLATYKSLAFRKGQPDI